MRPRAGAARTTAPHADDVMKILISTDNHLGYLEKDPVRGDDSFRVFEEVLEVAKANNVDMLLLGGDLFHDNKPSRHTLVSTMRILRRHCLSPDGEVRLAVRSDPALVNYMDPCVAVSMPVFVIHGNHDDPTGGTGLDALSSLDLLAQAGLVTYFGRAKSSKKVEVAPVLLQKGSTALALYGLGNIRDEVLYDTWARQKRVKWLSPAQPATSLSADQAAQSASGEDEPEEPEGNGERGGGARDAENVVPWFNLFVLHQNRLTRGSSKGISDTLLPEWLDYVVWGHEHDSLPDLTLSKPPIVQPGSTVATSLSAGEAKAKHAILLEVYKGKLKHRVVPLHTVRNFEFQDVVLSEQADLSETDPEALQAFLKKTIADMVGNQQALFDVKLSSFQSGTSKEVVNGVRYPPRSFYISKLSQLVRQPLVRLRVEMTGNWEVPNPQRFGQEYIGIVANAPDVLLLYRNKRRPVKTSRAFLQGHAPDADPGEENGPDTVDFSQRTGDEEDVVHIPKLVQYFLYHRQAGGSGLKFLELDRLSGAVDEFVNKLENGAIPQYVSSYLKTQQDKTLKEASAGGKGLNETELLRKFEHEATAAANRIFSDKEPNHAGKKDGSEAVRNPNGIDKDMDVTMTKENASSPTDDVCSGLDGVHAILSNNPKIAAATAANRAAFEKSESRDESDEDDIQAAPAKTLNARTPAKGRGRGRGRGPSPAALSRNSLAQKPPLREVPTRRASRRGKTSMAVNGDEEGAAEVVEASNEDVIVEESEEEYVPVPTTRKRRARGNLTEPRSASRGRVTPTPTTSQRRRSVFANRARLRQHTATIDLDEESGDDAM